MSIKCLRKIIYTSILSALLLLPNSYKAYAWYIRDDVIIPNRIFESATFSGQQNYRISLGRSPCWSNLTIQDFTLASRISELFAYDSSGYMQERTSTIKLINGDLRNQSHMIYGDADVTYNLYVNNVRNGSLNTDSSSKNYNFTINSTSSVGIGGSGPISSIRINGNSTVQLTNGNTSTLDVESGEAIVQGTVQYLRASYTDGPTVRILNNSHISTLTTEDYYLDYLVLDAYADIDNLDIYDNNKSNNLTLNNSRIGSFNVRHGTRGSSDAGSLILNLRNSTIQGGTFDLTNVRTTLVLDNSRVSPAIQLGAQNYDITIKNNNTYSLSNVGAEGSSLRLTYTNVASQQNLSGISGNRNTTMDINATGNVSNLNLSRTFHTLTVSGLNTIALTDATIVNAFTLQNGGGNISLANSTITTYSNTSSNGAYSISLTNSTLSGSGGNRDTIVLSGSSSIALDRALLNIFSVENSHNNASITNSTIAGLRLLGGSTNNNVVITGSSARTLDVLHDASSPNSKTGETYNNNRITINTSTVSDRINLHTKSSLTLNTSNVNSITAESTNYVAVHNNSTVRAIDLTNQDALQNFVSIDASAVDSVTLAGSGSLQLNGASVGGILSRKTNTMTIQGSSTVDTLVLQTGTDVITVQDSVLRHITANTNSGDVKTLHFDNSHVEELILNENRTSLTLANNASVRFRNSAFTATNNINFSTGTNTVIFENSTISTVFEKTTGNNAHIEFRNMNLNGLTVQNGANTVLLHNIQTSGELALLAGAHTLQLENRASARVVNNSSITQLNIYNGTAAANTFNAQGTRIGTAHIGAQSNQNTLVFDNASVIETLTVEESQANNITLTNNSRIQQGTLQGAGNTIISQSNAQINNFNISGSNNTLSLTNATGSAVTLSGNTHAIQLHDSSLQITKSSGTHDFTFTSGDNLLAMHSSTLSIPTLTLGSGNNSLELNATNLGGSIMGTNGTANIALANNSTVEGIRAGNSTISINSSYVRGDVELDAGTQSSFTLTRGTVDGSIVATNGTTDITLSNNSMVENIRVGDSSINITGSRVLNNIEVREDAQSTVTIVASMIHGDILLRSTANNAPIALTQEELHGILTKNTLPPDQIQQNVTFMRSNVHGSIDARAANTTFEKNNTVGGDIRAYALNLADNLTFYDIEKPFSPGNFAIESNIITLGENARIVANPGIAGDNVLVSGIVAIPENKGAVLAVDVDFDTGESDSFTFFSPIATKDASIFVNVNATAPIRRSSTTVDRIEGVLKFQSNGDYILPLIDVGGYNYQFIESLNYGQWDLIRAGKSPYNNIYPLLEKYNHAISNSFWNGLQKQFHSIRINDPEVVEKTYDEKILVRNGKRYRIRKPIYPKKKFGDFIALWINASGGSLQMQHQGFKLADTLLNATMGLDIKELDIPEHVRFNVHLFAGYTRGLFDIKNPGLITTQPSGTATMLAAGGMFDIESLFSPKYQIYFSMGAWATMFENYLNLNMRRAPSIRSYDKWGFYTVNAAATLGTKFFLKRVFFLPQIDVLYKYTPTHHFTLSDKSAVVEFSERHMLTARLSATVGYSFPIGLKPYVRVGAEMNFDFSKDKNLYVGNLAYNYAPDELDILAGLGLQYSGKSHGISYAAFIDVTTLLAKRTQNYMANLGFTIGF